MDDIIVCVEGFLPKGKEQIHGVLSVSRFSWFHTGLLGSSIADHNQDGLYGVCNSFSKTERPEINGVVI